MRHRVSWFGPACAAVLALCSPAAAAPEASVELRRLTQELLDAIAPGRAEVWRRHLDERAIHVDESGTVRNKAELLAELTPLPPGLVGRLEIGSFEVRVHGNFAVATHEDREHLDYHGQILDSRFRITDTWKRTRTGWKLVASQVLAVQRDPPPIALERAALCAYNGIYRLTPEIQTEARCVDGGLHMERTGRPAVTYRPEVADVFFAPGQPRTRRIFVRDARGAVTGFVDRREGLDVVWRRVATAP